MKLCLHALMALLAHLVAVSPVYAAPTEPAERQTETEGTRPHPQAYRLAQVLRPESMMREQMSQPAYADFLRAVVLADPGTAELETEFPGSADVMIRAMLPSVIEYSIGEMPSLWASLAELLAANLNSTEIDAATEFYSSPETVAFIENLRENVDYDQFSEVFDAQGNADAQQFQRATISETTRQFERGPDADFARFTLFALTPAGRKITEIFPQILELEVEWMNSPDFGADLVLGAIAEEALIEFLDANYPVVEGSTNAEEAGE